MPNEVIKSAVAAEWLLQTYRLGKPPLLVNESGRNDACARSSNHLSRRAADDAQLFALEAVTQTPSMLRRASYAFGNHDAMSTDLHQTPPASTGIETPLRSRHETKGTILSDPDLEISARYSFAARRIPSNSTSSSSDAIFLSRDLSEDTFAAFGINEGFGTDLRSGVLRSVSSSTRVDQAKPPTSAALTRALLQASHAECEPGTTADLLSVVLNRDARD